MRANGSSIRKSTIKTTVIITMTFASSKFCPATTNAAAAFLCAVPRASIPRVLFAGPPSSHPIPTQTTVYTTAARTPKVPNTDRTLLKWPAIVNTTTRIMLMLEIHPTAGRMRPAAPGRRARTRRPTAGQRDEHQHDERPRDLHRVDRDSLEEERQSEGQVAHGDDHQQHHQAHSEGQIGLGELRELDQKRRARRQPAQQQADPQRLVETEHPPEPERYQGAQDEVRRE